MEDTYKKNKGNAGLEGIQFQLNLLTVCLLNAFRSHTNWKISSENQNAGKYDDIVVELRDGDAVLIQAKYRENRKITKDQLLSDNAKNSDFSLPKYFFSYEEIKTKFNAKTVIICTNTEINPKGLENVLTSQMANTDSMLHYDSDICSFYTFNENILPDLKRSTKKYLEKNLQGKGFDKALITDKNLKAFLKNLQIFSCYPSGDNLNKAIGHLLSQLSHDSLWNKISVQEIFNQIESWFKHPRAVYLTEPCARNMICEIRSNKYCDSLKDYNVSFECKDLNFSESKNIIHVKAEQGYLLQMLKVFCFLQNDRSRKLYVNPDDNIEVQNRVVEAFEQRCYSYLIMAWSKIRDNIAKSNIIAKLKEILENHHYKKVILVAECNSNLEQQIGLKDISQVEGSVTFNDLSEDCQKKLLENRNVVFQGKRVSLKELLQTRATEDYTHLLSSEMLETLIRREKIKVGELLLNLNEDVTSYYIHRKFEIHNEETGKGEDVLEEKLYDTCGKMIIISDSAGMGKSTVLTKMAYDIKKKHSYLWIIKINLNDYTRILKEHLRRNRTTINVTEFLNSNEATKLTNKFETLVFSMKQKVVLMLDGMDEISPDYTDLILDLLSQCQRSPNFKKVFVTTRHHVALKLRTALKVQFLNMLPFTTSNQTDFLVNYWTHNLQIDHTSEQKCQQYAKTLIYSMSSWIGSNYKDDLFTAIPLQLRMLAEIFQENNQPVDWEGCKEFLETDALIPKLPEKFNIANLYHDFIQKKRDVFMDKANPSGSVMANPALVNQFEACLAYHRSLALKIILDETETALFTHCDPSDSDAYKEYVLNIGIIQKFGNTFQFIHRTFAEYFLAECIVQELEYENQNFHFQRFLIDEVLPNDRFEVVCAFLDILLQKIRLSPHIFEPYKSIKSSTKILGLELYSKKKYGSVIYTTNLYIIFRLAQKGYLSILKLILHSIHFSIVKGRTIAVSDLKPEITFKERNTLNDLEALVGIAGINIINDQGETPLHCAVKGGHLDMVEFLRRLKADVDARDNDGRTVLHVAGKSQQWKILEYLVEHHACVSQRDYRGREVLHYAAQYDHVDTVEYVLKHGADINARDIFDNTPLHMAVRYLCWKTTRYLVEHGANVNITNIDGYTVLHSAVELCTSFGIVEQLATHFDVTPFRSDVVRYLVEHDANVNAVDKKGRTPLHLAAELGMLEVTKYLAVHSANVNAIDEEGSTVLHLVVEWDELDVVKCIVERHADVNIKNKDGRTALHLTVESCRLDSLEYLVVHGGDVNIKDNKNNTALHLAIQRGQSDIVKYLIDSGADLNVRNDKGRTPLHMAAEVSNLHRLDVLKHLVEHSGDVDAKDGEGNTALHLAVRGRYWNAVKHLVEYGADVNIRDDEGRTALHLAAEVSNMRRLDTLRYLVEHGGDIRVRNKKGDTVLHVALDKFNHLTDKYFEERDPDSDVNE